MKETPLISVIMPVYNAENYLGIAIESILKQTLSDFEFIVVNDGSSDNSAKILEHYAKIDPRIRILNNSKNEGIVTSLNLGLSHACGEFIARMDADDISLPFRLERQNQFFRMNHDVLALGSAVSYIDSVGSELEVVRKCALHTSFLFHNPLLHPTVMFRRKPFIDAGFCYREEFRYAEDYFLWLELGKIGKLCALEEVLLLYRVTPQASRFKHLREMLLAGIRVKIAARHRLKYRPTPVDLLRLLLEILLMTIPQKSVEVLYLFMNFR
ncbi:MAG: glycosyltransferase [Candidatus Riflebacteria bacterium]|nr:glycosyltransferase [Candidatus Riflebacteria bacterium]